VLKEKERCECLWLAKIHAGVLRVMTPCHLIDSSLGVGNHISCFIRFEVFMVGLPLCSSGQGSWLQIQRS
jgi:hypothetical protein